MPASLWGLGIASVGGLFVWAGLNNADPIDVLRNIVQGKSPVPGPKSSRFSALMKASGGSAGTGTPSASGGRSTIVSTAQSLIGVKYNSPGTTDIAKAKAIGVDCSGLVAICYGAVGIKTSEHSAGSWARHKYAKQIREADAQPGDLLCMHPGTWSGFGHIGIFVSPGKMIDAPTYGTPVGVHNYKGYGMTGAVFINIIDNIPEASKNVETSKAVK